MKNMILFKLKSNSQKIFLNSHLGFAFLGIIFFVSGCAVSLAPKFDQGIVDNLSASSTEVFQLLAKVSGGTSKSDYDKREEKYNTIIGKLEALELQIKARPVPDNKTVDKIISKANERLKQRGVSTFITAGDTAPSATALEQIIKSFEQMKNTDKTIGLQPLVVQTHKGAIQLFLDQAITYERFLNK